MDCRVPPLLLLHFKVLIDLLETIWQLIREEIPQNVMLEAFYCSYEIISIVFDQMLKSRIDDLNEF